jgi:hypothetical protein
MLGACRLRRRRVAAFGLTRTLTMLLGDLSRPILSVLGFDQITGVLPPQFPSWIAMYPGTESMNPHPPAAPTGVDGIDLRVDSGVPTRMSRSAFKPAGCQ